MFNVNEIRKDFPILSRTVNGKPLVYFDNGATAQKPQQVIDAISHYYAFQNSNIHRGVHTLSREITIAYEEARKQYNFTSTQNKRVKLFSQKELLNQST